MIDMFREEDSESCSAMIRECVTKSRGFNQAEAQLIIEKDTAEGLVEKSRRFPLFVYRDKDEVIGICGLDGNEIRGCFIKYGKQNQGIGRRLVEHIERYAKKRGINRLTLDSALSARRFWESLGFREIRRFTKTYQGHKFENSVMTKSLD